MNTNRIIIDCDVTIDNAIAVDLVKRVIEEGMVSTCSTGAHYCWLTTFTRGDSKIQVITRQRKKGQKSDSFIVRCSNETQTQT